MHAQLDGAARQRPVAGVEAPARRRYLLRGDRMARGRARSCSRRVARAVLERRPRRPRARSSTRRTRPRWPAPERAPVSSAERRRRAGRRTARRGAAAHARQRPRRLRRRRPRVRRSSSTGDEETPLPWVNVIANPRFGTIVTGVGLGVHLGGEQPREPPDAVRQRPGHRPDRRGAVHPRRRDGRRLVADAGADARATRRAAGASIRARGRASRRFTRVDARHPRTSSTVFVDVDDPVKFSLLTLDQRRRATPAPLSVFAYNEWMPRAAARRARRGHVMTELRRGDAARSSRATPTTTSSPAASRSRTRASRRARRPATGSSFLGPQRLARAAGGARAASARPGASAPGSIRARRCTVAIDARARRDAHASSFLLGQGADRAQARRAGRAPRRRVAAADGRARARSQASGTRRSSAIQVQHAGRLLRRADEPLARSTRT